jgi:hypothetical protein
MRKLWKCTKLLVEPKLDLTVESLLHWYTEIKDPYKNYIHCCMPSCCIWTQIVPMPCLMSRGCSKISASWICSSWISNKLCCQRAPSCYTESKNFSIRRCLCGSCSSAFANFNLKLFQWYILSFLKNCSNVGCFKKNCDHKALTNWRDSWDPNYWFVQK